MAHAHLFTNWDPTVVERGDVDTIYAHGIRFDRLPAALGQMTSLKDILFQSCTIDGFDTAAFGSESEGRQVTVAFSDCELDHDALFEFVLEHGSGRWNIAVNDLKQSKRFKLLHKIGNDHAGDRAMRAASFSLLPEGSKFFTSTLPSTADASHLRLLNHSKKPIRELALVYLEKAWPNPLATKPLDAGACLRLLGKPTYRPLAEIKERIAERGCKLAAGKAKPTHVVLFDRPGAKLDHAMTSGLPLLLESQLFASLEGDVTPVEPATEKEADNLEALLLHRDPANGRLALQMLSSRPLPDYIVPALMGTALLHPDKTVRLEAKTLLMKGPDPRMRERLQGDNRAHHKVTDGAKLWKLARDLHAQVGIDPEAFSVVLVRVFQTHNPSYVDEALSVALRFEDNGPRVFPFLAQRDVVYMPVIKKHFPKGMGALKSMERLRVQGWHTSGLNIEELAALPKLRSLEYWVKDARLSLLRPLAHLRELAFRGGYSGLTDISELAAWRDLEVLDIADTGVADLSPLAAATKLRVLNIDGTPVSDLSPLRSLTSLRHVRVSKTSVTDFSALAGLRDLEHLNVGFLSVGDLSFTAAMTKLNSIDLWGAKVSSLDALVDKPLTSIELLYTDLPDLTPLAKIPTLGSLCLIGTHPPQAQLDLLQAALPNLYIRM